MLWRGNSKNSPPLNRKAPKWPNHCQNFCSEFVPEWKHYSVKICEEIVGKLVHWLFSPLTDLPGDSSRSRIPRLDTAIYSMLCLQNGAYHGFLLRGTTRSWLRQKHILTPNHWTEVGDPYGWIRGRIEEAERESHPIERPTVSPNPDSRELPETEPPTRSIQWPVWGPWHIHSWYLPGLASVGE